MEKFEDFLIVNQEVIFGGESKPTMYTTENGKRGKDSYETVTKTIKYLS